MASKYGSEKWSLREGITSAYVLYRSPFLIFVENLPSLSSVFTCDPMRWILDATLEECFRYCREQESRQS